jgi:2'-5' RNA ligase
VANTADTRCAPQAVVRTFIAVSLPVTVQLALANLQYQELLPGWNWVKPENMHITLRFLGNTTSKQLEQVTKACCKAVSNLHAFNMRVHKTGVFPNWGRPQVYWAGLAGQTANLQNLANQLEKALVAMGLPAADKPFRPHITLARCRGLCPAVVGERLQQSGQHLDTEFAVESITVFRSDLTPQGSVYKPLQVIQLAAQPGERELRKKE